jgi:hypothetical protein
MEDPSNSDHDVDHFGHSGLSTPVREHLGKQLRSTYHALEAKPAYLGDEAVPAQFDGFIRRLEEHDRRHVEAVHDKAVAAVETALKDIPRE